LLTSQLHHMLVKLNSIMFNIDLIQLITLSILLTLNLYGLNLT